MLSHDQYQNQWRNGGIRNCAISQDLVPHSHGSWDKNKNPYLLKNCIIPNEATIGGPGTARSPEVECVLGLQPLLSWEICDFSVGVVLAVIADRQTCVEMYSAGIPS